MGKLEKYSAYKDSGVEWLGEIPEEWKVIKIGHFFKANKGINAAKLTKEYCAMIQGKYNVYSGQTENNGIMDSINIYEFDFEEQGCLFTTTVGAKAMTLNYLQEKFNLSQNCMIMFSNKNDIYNKFFYYHLQPLFAVKRQLIPDHMQPSFRMEDFYQLNATLPPKKEQLKIASFLDTKTEQLDKAIKQKEQLINLLKERRQILINDAVTKGIDKTVTMKDSGVEWIGEIPEHWEVKKNKYIFFEVDERSKDGKEELLSVSHMTGVTPRSEKTVNMFMSEDYTGSKTCSKDDLVINIMWAWMGAMGISDRTGIVSSSYGIYRQIKANTINTVYLEYLLKTNKYIEEYNKRSTGLHVSRLRLYSDMFFDMKIGFPENQEQEEIVNYIEQNNQKIDKAIDLQQQQIIKLKEYKTTLIDSVVTGKVRIK
jgi:type I restriction enzyme, S subunit